MHVCSLTEVVNDRRSIKLTNAKAEPYETWYEVCKGMITNASCICNCKRALPEMCEINGTQRDRPHHYPTGCSTYEPTDRISITFGIRDTTIKVAE
jgi:hypothetical protein